MARILARLRRETPTWFAHAAIASAVTVVFDPFLGDWESWRLAVWGYAFREGDQLIRQWLKRWRSWGTMLHVKSGLREQWLCWKEATWHWAEDTNWLGSAGDVLAPALVAALVTLRWLL